jgi:peptidyl-prolyl cis-trans isomerase D
MSVLEKLRKRSGLLVTIVGLALLTFVLMGLLESKTSLFGKSDNIIGEIGGESIEKDIFKAKVDEAEEAEKRNAQKTTLDQNEIDQIVQRIWNQMINEKVLNKEYEKLGISVSDEELYDLMIDHPHSEVVRQMTDQKTGKVNPQFADPKTGKVSPDKIRAFTQSMKDEDEGRWAQLETYIRQVRIVEKYNNLIKKGLYVTSAVAKRDFIAQNSPAMIKYIIKSYKLVADSTIKVNDADLNAYYTEHQNEYKQVASRKIEYIAFDVTPSQDDIDQVKKDMQAAAEDFNKQKTFSEDSSFVIAESDNRNFDMTFHTKGTLSPIIDSSMFDGEVGKVIGPYIENGTYKVSKLIAVKLSADSAKVRHILIGYKGAAQAQPNIIRTKEQAKKMADSLLTVIKKGGKFADYVEKFSDDNGKNAKPQPGKKPTDFIMGKDGEYGWLNAKSQFVEPFKNAALDGKKGDLVVVESQYGFHIIEVLDSKGSQKKVQVANIEKKIEPSSKTTQSVYVKASEFAGKNTTNELFQKAVLDNKLNKRIADNIKESDKTIAGIESPKTLIRWAYDSKKGTVSDPIEFTDKFIVAVLTDVREKGIAPLDQVKEEVTAKFVQQKKAEQFTNEFNTAMAGSVAIDALSTKLKIAIQQAPNVNFNTASIPGSSSEPSILGAVSVQKAKTMSKPLAGKEGVFVVYVDSKTEAPVQKDYKTQQTQAITQLQPRVDYEVYDALKENANIVEHLVKFGY